MDLSLSEDGRVTIVSIKGDLTIGEAETAFKKALARLVEQGKVNLLVDCSALRMVDSTGLGALVRALTLTQNEGGQTKLLNVGPHLRKLLEMTQLHSVFESFADRDEALSSF